jgi:effector-binding domain-containing protein
MPLEQVRAVLDAPDVISRNEAILTHLRHMQEQLERTQTTVASLQALLEDVHRTSTVTRRAIGPLSTLAITETVRFDDSGDWCGAAFDELHGELAGAGLMSAGPDGALYFSEFFELGLGTVTAFVPLLGDIDPAGRAERLDLAAADVAVLIHEGPFADLDRTYGALGTHVALQRIGAEGPIREHYIVAGDDVDEADHRTEVCWPITLQPRQPTDPQPTDPQPRRGATP